jgi:hypothetical protein
VPSSSRPLTASWPCARGLDRFDAKAKLKQGDVLLADTRSCVIDHPDICDEKREWTYVNSVRHEGHEVIAQGWVARRFIQEFVCPE